MAGALDSDRRSRPWAVGLASIVVLVGLVLACWQRWAVHTDITHFLVDDTDLAMAEVSRQLAASELTRTIVLSIHADGGDAAPALAAARGLAGALASEPEVAWVRTGPASVVGEALHGIYFPHRYHLLDDPAMLTDAGLATAAKALKLELGRPTSTLIKQVAPADPLLLYPQQLRRLEAARGVGVDIVDGQFLSDDGHALVLLATRHSPFSPAAQAPLQAAIAEAFAAERSTAAGINLQLQQSGVAQFALAAEASMRADVTRISTISLAGLLVLFILIFRSVRVIALAIAPLAFGILAALASCLWLFGGVHGWRPGCGSGH